MGPEYGGAETRADSVAPQSCALRVVGLSVYTKHAACA